MIIWILLWLFYFILHSVLAADGVKAWFSKKTGARFRYYRIGYNLIAIGTLMPLLVWYRTLTPLVLWQPGPLMEALAAGLVLAGLIVGYLALRSYSLGEFSGLSYLRHLSPAQSLVTTGLNRYVRHPLYFSLVLLMSGYLLHSGTDTHLAVFVVVLAYLIIGSRLEERKLEATYGDAYRAYQQRVRRLVPFIF
jgi:methanethiol S-methyltransferase